MEQRRQLVHPRRAPCIGCSHPQFGKLKSFPFYRKGEALHAVAYNETDRKGGEA
jgi:Ni,Fe-hydrogenase I small subunit